MIKLMCVFIYFDGILWQTKAYIPPDIFWLCWGRQRNTFRVGNNSNNFFHNQKTYFFVMSLNDHETGPHLYLILLKNPYRI